MIPRLNAPSGVWLVADPARMRGKGVITVAERALAGGVSAVQLRANSLVSREIHVLAKTLRLLTAETDAWLVINDRADIALAVGADGVHLGGHSLPLESVKRAAPGLKVGKSCHGVREVHEAEQQGSDYVFLGPIFWTASKAEFGDPLGVGVLREACGSCSIPVVAIGGVGPDQATSVMASGAAGLAAIGALVESQDVKAAAEALVEVAVRGRIGATPMPSPMGGG